jgi:hypothetical protein
MPTPNEALATVQAAQRMLTQRIHDFSASWSMFVQAENARLEEIGVPRGSASIWQGHPIAHAQWNAFDQTWGPRIGRDVLALDAARRPIREALNIVGEVDFSRAPDLAQRTREGLMQVHRDLLRARSLVEMWRGHPSSGHDEQTSTAMQTLLFVLPDEVWRTATGDRLTLRTHLEYLEEHGVPEVLLQYAEQEYDLDTGRGDGKGGSGRGIPLWTIVVGAVGISAVALYIKYATPAGRAVSMLGAVRDED